MNRLIIIIGVFLTSVSFAQTKYEVAMNSALQQWKEGQIAEASALFERIANAEKEEWLPQYYLAHIGVIRSFSETDIEVKETLLIAAQKNLDIAKELSADNVEIMCLQGLLNTAYISFDAMKYAPQLSSKTIALYSKAAAMAPENPRPQYLLAEFNMGSAKFFGEDTRPYCTMMDEAVEKFDIFKPASTLHPKWGKQRALDLLLKNCL